MATTTATILPQGHFYYQPTLDNFAAHRPRSEFGMVWIMLLATVTILGILAYSLPETIEGDVSRTREIRSLQMLTEPKAATHTIVQH